MNILWKFIHPNPLGSVVIFKGDREVTYAPGYNWASFSSTKAWFELGYSVYLLEIARLPHGSLKQILQKISPTFVLTGPQPFIRENIDLSHLNIQCIWGIGELPLWKKGSLINVEALEFVKKNKDFFTIICIDKTWCEIFKKYGIKAYYIPIGIPKEFFYPTNYLPKIYPVTWIVGYFTPPQSLLEAELKEIVDRHLEIKKQDYSYPLIANIMDEIFATNEESIAWNKFSKICDDIGERYESMRYFIFHDLVKCNIPITIFGWRPPPLEAPNVYYQGPLPWIWLPFIFGITAININIHRAVYDFGTQEKVLMCALCKAFCLTDYKEIFKEMFPACYKEITFKNSKELHQKIFYFLKHDKERAEIIEELYKRVKENYTYKHYVKKILQIFGEKYYDTLISKPTVNFIQELYSDITAFINKKVSIILIHYKDINNILECLNSIYKNNYDHYQIIIIDNNSKIDPFQKLSSLARKEKKEFLECNINHFHYPQELFKKELILIRSKENLGFAGGNNLGIKYALNCGADYIWLLNDDTVIEKNALIELVKLAETDKKIGLIASKLYCYNNPEKVQYNGEKAIYEGMDDIKGELPKPTNFASGCSLFMRREFIEKVGFLDEDYFLYFEDNDISARALKAGWKVYYNPYSKVYHKGGVSIGGWLKSPLSVYYATRNLLLYHYKHNFFDVSRDFDYLKNQIFSQLDGDKIRVYAFVQGIEDFIYGKKGKAEIDFEKIVGIIEETEKETKEIENILKEFFEKDLKEKFSLIKKALILNPSQTDLIDKFLNLAQALFFKESLKRSNDNLLNYCQEAEKLYSDGQVEEAVKLFKKVLELDPNFALAHNDLAFIYWQNKDTKKALYHLTKAITLAPEDRDIIWNCGQIMFSLGYIKDAYEVYKNYLQKHPDEVEIRQVIEELEKIIVNNDFKKISFTS
ncbi:MAG TPA: glycosyltransferase [Candidatus Desulfofervidus auxilii]|uniref:Glycosyltransferase n=1 Tax=Desulfofervidus auxilii TaxID=1621989 RepID=A0A7C0U3K8_DESA2|nr:glycosyltransferase [Candidatus Desulfofervidus auxilii]